MNNLEKYGLNEFFIEKSKDYEGLKLARVIAQYRGIYKIIVKEGELLAEVSGKFKFETKEVTLYPVVGDFVMVSYGDFGEKAIIHNLLTRKSLFVRANKDMKGKTQAVVSNIDIIFICISLNKNYNLNRLERYISIVWDSGATPIILLTKSDLCHNLDKLIFDVEKVSGFSEVISVSMFDENFKEKLSKYILKGVTAAFIGSSGVGKSTIINKILGNDFIKTKGVGKLDKGMHTTTIREMYSSPYGGVIIDTSGMREIGVETADLAKTFVDIEQLLDKCKYNDCTHSVEPECAIQKALDQGIIDHRRLKNYLKIKVESECNGLNFKEIETKKLQRMFKETG